ncbi:toxin-antitoxin system HicB family antitoxin [Caballeronia sp. INSB1]|uniref:toxin-antitoxin system HicB family antitoxin n=1 Tax=Caballeronia sp. INSB1 TaxID=2921751 RepID=UPI0020329786|nr:toxin-antitoxin system HicB family antitoxin [Caballeronia sp. INSB1]
MKMNFGNSTSSAPEGVTADMYSVTVRRERIEGEIFFVGRVREFPDVEIFEETHEAAYSVTVATLTDLIVHLRDEGIPVPQPLAINDSFSGRVTLRMTKSMHRRVDRCAEDEGVSINTFLVCAVESYLAHASTRARHTPKDVLTAAPALTMIRCDHATANTSQPPAKVIPRTAGYAFVKNMWSDKPAVLPEVHWIGEGAARATGYGRLNADQFWLAGDDADPIHRHYFPGIR